MSGAADVEYVHPDPAARRRAIVLQIGIVAGACLLGLVLFTVVRPWLARYFEALAALATHDPLAAKQRLLVLTALIAGLNAAIAVGVGVYTIRLGRHTVRAARWPYPGMRIYRRYRVREGAAARRRGRLLVAVGVALAILGPALAISMWAAVSRAPATWRPAPRGPGARD